VYLFELAIELGVRSADLADAAPGLGLDGVTPTSELTSEQAEALRAHFTDAQRGPDPDAPGSDRSYQPRPAKPPAPTTPVPVAPAARRGPNLGQMVLVALVVAGVLGVVAFMVAKSRSDQERRERIAAAEPQEDGVPTRGPDGRPLTEQQQLDLARMEAARADALEQTCSALRGLRDAERDLRDALHAEPLDQAKARTLAAAAPLLMRFDQVIALLPDQAADARSLQQGERDAIAAVQAAATPQDLEEQLRALGDRAEGEGRVAAAMRFDAFAESTCGFSVVAR
jgi:hypothetical protein